MRTRIIISDKKTDKNLAVIAFECRIDDERIDKEKIEDKVEGMLPYLLDTVSEIIEDELWDKRIRYVVG